MKTKHILMGIALLSVLGFAPFVRHAVLPANCTQVGVTLAGNTLWECLPDAATATPTASVTIAPTSTNTPVPPTGTPAPTDTIIAPTATVSPTASGCCAAFWHAPDGNHEHGDAPPQWLLNAGYTPSFTWPGNTPNENSISTKHSAFKGYSFTLEGSDVYFILHNDVNPGGDASRFHSLQFWWRDPSGNVSALGIWLDFGPDNTTQTGPNIVPRGCGLDETIRPVIFVNVQTCPNGTHPAQLFADVWYNRAGGPYGGSAGWAPDLGIFTSATYFYGGDPSLPSTWVPTGGLNLNRSGDVSWYAFRDSHRGEFWSTQFGVIVSGPADPLCGTSKIVGTRTYTVVCLREYIAPTAVTIGYPGNSFARVYPGPVSLPN